MGVAVHARVHGHDQAILDGQGRLDVHHVRLKREGLGKCCGTGHALLEQGRCLCGGDLQERGGLAAVVGRYRAVAHKILAAVGHRADVPGVPGKSVASALDEGLSPGGKTVQPELDIGIRPEGRQDPGCKRSVSGERGVRGQRVEWIISGREDLDLKRIHERAGLKRGLGNLGRDGAKRCVRRGLADRDGQTKDVVKLLGQPVTRGGAIEVVPVSGKNAPGLTRGGALGAQQEVIQLVSDGSVDMAIASGTQLENLNPEFSTLNLPTVFDGIDHQIDVLGNEEIVGELFSSLEESKNLTVLGGLTQGDRNLYTVKGPIIEPADLAGMKIRVQESDLHIAMINAMGGSATPMSYGEVYAALQSGVLGM